MLSMLPGGRDLTIVPGKEQMKEVLGLLTQEGYRRLFDYNHVEGGGVLRFGYRHFRAHLGRTSASLFICFADRVRQPCG